MQTQAQALSCLKFDEQQSNTLSVYVTNLGKYNEGELIGEWLSLPTTPETLKACLNRIDIDGIKYEEYFITDYLSTIGGLTNIFSEYSDIDELNYLASKLDELNRDELTIFEAAIEMGYASSLEDLINLTDSLDDFQCLPDVHDEYDLGYYWIEESGSYDLSSLGNLSCYFDYERFGRDIHFEQSGVFSSIGYIYYVG